MRRALISDIHGNLEALEVVLDDIKAQGITEIFCLGDIIGYGPNPRECIDRVMEHCSVCLLGNHDQGALFDPDGFNVGAERAIFWTREQLESPADRANNEKRWEFLGELPRTHRLNQFLFVHGSPRNPLSEYIFPEDIYNQRKMERLFQLVEKYCFQGHTHVPGVFTENYQFNSPEEIDHEYVLGEGKLMINVGSVDSPATATPRACYVILDDGRDARISYETVEYKYEEAPATDGAIPLDEQPNPPSGPIRVTFRRLAYDFETTIKKIYAVPELEPFLGDRLRQGAEPPSPPFVPPSLRTAHPSELPQPMSNESKRLFLFATAFLVWMASANFILEKLGYFPKAKPRPPVIQAEEQPGEAAKDAPAQAANEAKPAAEKGAPAPAAPPKVEPVKEALLLGDLSDKEGYRLRAGLSQAGAGVNVIELAQHEAERDSRRKERRPLKLVDPGPSGVPSFVLNILSVQDGGQPAAASGPILLDSRLWEVVRDDQRAVRPIVDDRAKPPAVIGQEVVFRTTIDDPAVTITKTFRLKKGTEGLELILGFESPRVDRKIVYQLTGPHGLPIEGEWYTSVFRETFFGLADGTNTKVETRLASDVVKGYEARLAAEEQGNPDPTERFGKTLPVRYAGVENQYFTVFFTPDPPPANGKRIDDLTESAVVEIDPKDKQKSDVTVAMTSLPIAVGPNRPMTQAFKIYAGPKKTDLLRPYGAEKLAEYRKSGWFVIPYASTLAQGVIAPLLDRIYGVTASVSAMFGGKRGNYGIAIILLTITVRMILFPLSRKQAISAKRMQDLNPLLAEIKEKYKDDKEAQTRETFALYKTYKVNPFGGCLLGVIQLPIFVGLWQALNNSVALRHASFLWIDNLAATDMLFRFPFEVPILGRYFNLLPFAVVGLMLVQMKLFSPPATTPDQEMSQKMMKYMMVFMSFMFYKVPSGLGLYFITSSTWAICERLLLPKMIKTKPLPPATGNEGNGRGARPGDRPGPNGNGNGNGNGPKPGGFRDRLRQLMEEAAKDQTVRNKDKEKEKEREWDKPSRPRPKPGRKR